MLQAQDVIKHWNRRYATPFGRITIIKTFIMSKFIHIFTSLPTPSDDKIKEINKLIFTFLWDNKPEKIKRYQTIPELSRRWFKNDKC